AEDVPLLAAHFLQKYARPGVAIKQLAPEAIESLLRYRWPGNVRELENAIERACVTARDHVVRPENLPAEIRKPTSATRAVRVDLSRRLDEQLPDVIAAFEERYLRRALRKARGNLARVARIAGLPINGLSDKILRCKIDP